MTVIKAATLLEAVAQELSLQLSSGFPQSLAKDDAARIALLASLQKLTTALETPEDVVNRTVFMVCVAFAEPFYLNTNS